MTGKIWAESVAGRDWEQLSTRKLPLTSLASFCCWRKPERERVPSNSLWACPAFLAGSLLTGSLRVTFMVSDSSFSARNFESGDKWRLINPQEFPQPGPGWHLLAQVHPQDMVAGGYSPVCRGSLCVTLSLSSSPSPCP